jgi:putative hydrolase of the HAD superfamily
VTTAAVLFDLDDTLFDHRACTREALREVQRRYAALGARPFGEFEAAHALLLEALHLDVLAGRLSIEAARQKRFESLLEQAGEPAAPALASQVAATYRQCYIRHRQAVPGALDLLRALHGHVALGVVTNNVASEQLEKIETCGMAPWLDAVIISEQVGVAKPDPRIFALALDRLGVAPDAAVMVGDNWAIDVVGARAAGLRAIWFNRLAAPSPDPAIPEIRALEPPESLLQRLGVAIPRRA